MLSSRTRVTGVAGLTLGLLLVGAPSALAGDPGRGGTGASGNGTEVTAVATHTTTVVRPPGQPEGSTEGAGGGDAGGGGGSYVPPACRYGFWMTGPAMAAYSAAFHPPLIAPPPAAAVAQHAAEEGGWYRAGCTYVAGTPDAFEANNLAFVADNPPVWSGTGPPPPPALPVEVLVETASDSARIPDPTISLNPADTTVTQLETWVWPQTGSFEQFTVSATSGPNTATVTVRPNGMQVSAANATAKGPCVAAPAWTGAGSAQTDCSVTFRRSSAGLPGGTSALQVTQSWSVTWAGSNGAGGRLADVTRTATLPVRVAEIQSSVVG